MKTEMTLELEKALMQSTEERRTFGVSEVTIGWYGRHRVDFMETNTSGVIRCYEIKVTKSDFYSKHGHNFAGHYNYYVFPKGLYEQVKDDIPAHVGVLEGTELKSVKRATRQKMLNSKSRQLLLYLLRSMSREVKKAFDADDISKLVELKRVADFYKRKASSWQREVFECHREISRLKRSRKQ